MKLDGQRARAERLHEKRPDIYSKPVSDCCGHVVWHGTFEDIFPKVVREKIIDFTIKEGLADDPGVYGGIAALKEYDRWCEKMLGPKRVKTPEVFCVSSANYSERTKDLFKKFKDSLNKAYAISYFDLKDIREDFEKEYNYLGLGKIFDYKPYTYAQADVDATMLALNYYNEIKKQQEETKMEAKRCDRCGKLYDTEESQNYISSYMPGRYVSKYEKENYTEAKIKESHTLSIRIIYHGNSMNVDLCPDCRKKLVEFFESGADEAEE